MPDAKREGPGRPPLPEDERAHVHVGIRLTEAQAAKLEQLKAKGYSARDVLLAGLRKLR